MWSARCLLFMRQTRSIHAILEVCEFRFRQFCDCSWHIFPRKNGNFGRFEVTFDRPEFDRTQQSCCLSNALDKLYNHFGFCPCVCNVYICSPIGCRTITSAILYRFSRSFACRSEIWLFRRLLFLRQTGSRLPILEMCKVWFWQFRDCGGHIFPRIVTKTLPEI